MSPQGAVPGGTNLWHTIAIFMSKLHLYRAARLRLERAVLLTDRQIEIMRKARHILRRAASAT